MLCTIFLCCLAIHRTSFAIGLEFDGVYQANDAASKPCNVANFLTGKCSCPSVEGPAYNVRVIGDGAGGIGGSNFLACSSGSSALSSFAGLYMHDDSKNCRIANKLTGACSCPSGSSPIALRTLFDPSPGVIWGSTLALCAKSTNAPVAFGGAYQIDDNAVCRSGNPYTNGTCSCPANFQAQPTRAVIDRGPGQYGGSTIHTCLPQKIVQICKSSTGQPVMADISGATPASRAIQTCLDSLPTGGVLALPAGKYRVDSQIGLKKSVTLRTQGLENSTTRCAIDGNECARLIADPQLLVYAGMLNTVDASGKSGSIDSKTNPPNRVDGITIDHIVLDGNRANRSGSAAYTKCKGAGDGGFDNRYGFNAELFGDNLTVKYSASINALCGTALGFLGNNATIRSNTISNNGVNEPNLWSDGLTASYAHNSVIADNWLVDNTDVGLIVGGGRNVKVTDNRVTQVGKKAFSAMMLHSFFHNTPEDRISAKGWGDFTGALITGNTVDCAYTDTNPGKQCFYGFNLGDHAWTAGTIPLWGGAITNNNIRGGVIAINLDGMGDATHPTTLSNNTAVTKLNVLTSCTKVPGDRNVYSSAYNYNSKSGDSTAVFSPMPAGVTNQETHACIGN